MNGKISVFLSGIIAFLFLMPNVVSAAVHVAVVNLKDQTMIVKKTVKYFIIGRYQQVEKVLPRQVAHSDQLGCIKCGIVANTIIHRCPMQSFTIKAMRSTISLM